MPDNLSDRSEHIILRQATAADKKKIIDLIHYTVKTDYPKFYPLGVVDFFIGYHSAENISIKIMEGYYLVVFNNNKLIATGCLYKDEIGSIYIHPRFQRKGIGKQMVEKLMEKSLTTHFERIFLDSTINARPFYEKLGFQVLHPASQELENDTVLDYYRMVYVIAK